MKTRRYLVLAAVAAAGVFAAGSMPSAQAAPKDDLVAVVGAAGRTGVPVVEQLVARGYKVRALVRDVAAAQGKLPAGVELVAADVRDPNSLAPALKGAKYVISTIGAGGGPKADPTNGPREIDHLGVANLAKVSKAAGVKQLVLVSSSSVTKAAENPTPFMRPILAAKFEGEQALRASGVPYTVVRPGGLSDDPGGKLAVTFSQGDTTTGRIPRADVATACIEALGRAAALGRTVEIFSAKDAAPTDWAKSFGALQADVAPAAGN
jgi:uncharacterized protein YbjT (DUF2867 family)